jgi:hypothetical protein
VQLIFLFHLYLVLYVCIGILMILHSKFGGQFRHLDKATELVGSPVTARAKRTVRGQAIGLRAGICTERVACRTG